MSLIIPYKEDLNKNRGTFIRPNGEILSSFDLHNDFARHYCFGPLYEPLMHCLHFSSSSNDDTTFQELFNLLKKYHNYKGTIEEVNEYSSSKLTIEQLKLFKLWLKCSEQFDLTSDFMIYVLNFDKVETIRRTTIITTNPNPHIRFFNYYLMDWDVIDYPPMKYNSDTGMFEFDESNYFLGNSNDKMTEDKIEEIKEKVLIKDRPLFFK
jgi:hypothetical protein